MILLESRVWTQVAENMAGLFSKEIGRGRSEGFRKVRRESEGKRGREKEGGRVS